MPDWISISGLALGLVATTVGIIELRRATRAEREGNRAYVSVTYSVRKLPGKPDAAYLVFRNTGRVVARRITIDFGQETSWNNVRQNELYPFVQSAGIPELYPASELEYFVGLLDLKSRLNDLFENEVLATLTFTDSIVGTKSVPLTLSLKHQKFLRRAS